MPIDVHTYVHTDNLSGFVKEEENAEERAKRHDREQEEDDKRAREIELEKEKAKARQVRKNKNTSKKVVIFATGCRR